MIFARRFFKRRLDQKGFTLIELMITTAIMGIITPAMTFLYLRMSQGMASDEMHLQLQRLNSNVSLRIRDRLLANKHFFQNDSDGSGAAFLAQVDFGPTAPPVMSGSELPIIQDNTSLAPGFGAVTAVGDSLFLAINDMTVTEGGLGYYAPLTVTDSNITWPTPVVPTPTPEPTPQPAVFTIDVYRFYYYYLTTTNPKPIQGVTTYRLVEWRSVQFADFHELSAIPSAVLLKQVVSWIATPGSVAPNSAAVTLAYDPDVTDVSQAFYSLNSGGVTAAIPAPNQQITQSSWSYMTHVSSGILSGGFNYGIASNNPPWGNVPAVPEYASASVTTGFPGGFEVAADGPEAGRQVLVRMLLVAKGGAPQVVYNDMTTVNAVRDSW